MEENLSPIWPVLIVDDEPAAIAGSVLVLESSGITHLRTTTDSRTVLPLLREEPFAAVLLDLSMPHISGQELLTRIHEGYPDTPVIIVTGHNEIDTAIECMKNGAFDYLIKPVHETRLISAVRRAVDFRELKTEYAEFRRRVLSRNLDAPEAFASFVSNDPRIHSLFQYIETIAGSPRPVLITGETGVGKELVARAIHRISRPVGPFVSVNIAGLDDNVFSDALFGHVKGAFTGADQRRAGLVAQAAGGTLFLDEIGDLELSSQIKLLRLLQENEYHALGADAATPSEARIVVATNHDLRILQQEHRFRTDLFYRLHTHHVELGPLRDRPGDIPVLLDHFLSKAAATLGKTRPTAPRELPALLATYHFPGNIRELEGLVFNAVSRHRSRVLSMETFRDYIEKHRDSQSTDLKEDASPDAASPYAFFSRLPTLAEGQSGLIEEAMRRASGNMTAAAQLLGITRSGLSKAIKRKKIEIE